MLGWAIRLTSADVRDTIDVITWPALLPYLGIGICPGLTPQQHRIYKDGHTCILGSHRQNVVIVEADRYSQSATYVTSYELSYLLNSAVHYADRVSCCDEYKLIQLYRRLPCGVSLLTHISTFELIPVLPRLEPGALVTV